MWFSDNGINHHSSQNVVDSQGATDRVSPQQILTTVMTLIVVDKSTDNAKPHPICFLPQYQRQRKCFFQSVTHWREWGCLDSYRQRQINQSDCEISSNCGKILNRIRSRTITRRLHSQYYITCLPDSRSVGHVIVNGGKRLGRPVNIKEVNKQAKIYVGRPLTLHIFCFMVIDYTWNT